MNEKNKELKNAILKKIEHSIGENERVHIFPGQTKFNFFDQEVQEQDTKFVE